MARKATPIGLSPGKTLEQALALERDSRAYGERSGVLGQAGCDIVLVLAEEGRPLTIAELATLTKRGLTPVRLAIKALRHHGFVTE